MGAIDWTTVLSISGAIGGLMGTALTFFGVPKMVDLLIAKGKQEMETQGKLQAIEVDQKAQEVAIELKKKSEGFTDMIKSFNDINEKLKECEQRDSEKAKLLSQALTQISVNSMVINQIIMADKDRAKPVFEHVVVPPLQEAIANKLPEAEKIIEDAKIYHD